MRNLDLWLEHIDTETTLPLFDQEAEEYTVSSVKDANWDAEPDFLVEIVRRQSLTAFKALTSPAQFQEVFVWLLDRDQSHLLLRSFDYLLSAICNRTLGNIEPGTLLQTMLNFLKAAPFLAISFGRMPPLDITDEYSDTLQTKLEVHAAEILRGYILSANEARELVVSPLQSFLSRIRSLTLDTFADLVELVSLTIRWPEVAMDVLLECLERESTRLLSGRPALIRHFVRNMTAIALDHIGEASEQSKARKDLLKLKLRPEERDGYQVVEIVFRIDSTGGTPENSAHVRLTPTAPPANSPLARMYSIDALVIHSEQGLARFQCFHPLPSFYDRCSWKLEYCSPFTTTKTMFDAVRDFAVHFNDCCGVADHILLGNVARPLSSDVTNTKHSLPEFPDRENLNRSQNMAVRAALKSDLTCLWGPPGTGKTETIVQMIRALQTTFSEARILVTAPTHNAVDNVMRRYISSLSPAAMAQNRHLAPLRVSTEFRKVAEDLRKYTCDAMAGQEIYANRLALEQAKKQVQNCRIIFTTCIGAGLGLLRSQIFDTVIVDEASQQTEPASLVPLVKGCEKAILVGDHVQLRPTVHQSSLVMEFDKSLFERLFAQAAGEPPKPDHTDSSPVARLMLDTQYRMHPSICNFSSTEFYDGKLRTGIPRTARPLFRSAFPWPPAPEQDQDQAPPRGDSARMVFLECPAREELGGKSKTNKGQADLCVRICQLLCTAAAGPAQGDSAPAAAEPQSIAVLTPYARQAELLKRLLSALGGRVEVSSIDGFQGREADVVVLVTVRCNESKEIGFLKDMRRMNVALTRARAGVVVVGNRETLTGTGPGASARGSEDVDLESKGMWRRLVGGLVRAEVEVEDPGSGVKS